MSEHFSSQIRLGKSEHGVTGDMTTQELYYHIIIYQLTPRAQWGPQEYFKLKLMDI